jgi:hypothetical protein
MGAGQLMHATIVGAVDHGSTETVAGADHGRLRLRDVIGIAFPSFKR